jgi:N-hydroxyarylamine O-acetyltransferase
LDLDAYFERIGYQGSPRPDEDTLFALHEAHLSAIPYENLDIQLGQTKLLDEARFEQRLVTERRGGWCYEMNGLFSAALRQIGFRVDRAGGAVVRDILGEKSHGNHMVLLVDLGRCFVADVGLGDGPVDPFPLEVGRWSDSGYEYALERSEDGWWRFLNQEHGLAPRFDFQETPRELHWYQKQCTDLQCNEESVFAGLALVFRRERKRVRALRDLTFIQVEGRERSESRIESEEEYTRLIHELVGIEDSSTRSKLWARVSARVRKRSAEKGAEEPAG